MRDCGAGAGLGGRGGDQRSTHSACWKWVCCGLKGTLHLHPTYVEALNSRTLLGNGVIADVIS